MIKQFDTCAQNIPNHTISKNFLLFFYGSFDTKLNPSLIPA